MEWGHVIMISTVCLVSAQRTPVTVQTKLGTITGSQVDNTFNGKTRKVNRFLGIPYAEPPTGNRRFMKPIPKWSLQSPFNASEFGPACPQDLFMMMGWVPGYPYVKEDCLTLNVFVPANRSHPGPLAVMVWIYGGAYVIGQSKMYSGENLTMIGDVIVVSMNYRVTSLGFLSTGSSKFPGNTGLWDQQLALQWIHDHIGDFGGDPNRVTIFGESAGGSSVLYHSLYQGNRGLFQRVIAESGSPLCPWAYQPDPRKYTRRLADRLGCTDHDLDAAVTCLQGLDVMLVVNNSRGIGTPEETTFRAEWVPNYDGDFITHTQSKLFNSNLSLFKNIDLMVGVNNNDGAFVTLLALQQYMVQQLNKTFDEGIPKSFFRDFYIPMYLTDMYGNSSALLQKWVDYVYTDFKDEHNDFNTRERFLEFSGDYNFFMPILAALRAHSGSRSFLYEFSRRPSFNTSPRWVEGANHGEELPFVFGFPTLMADGMGYRNHVPKEELKLSENMMTLWSNFAKTGDPNFPVTPVDHVVWPEYNTDTKRYLSFEQHGWSVSSNLFGARTAFWLELEPQLRALDLQAHQPHGSGHQSYVPVGPIIG